MHGYQIITKIRKNFGVYFGPSTIYPLLATLEKKGHVKSQWNMKTERPRKTYHLTNQGQAMLNFTENSLNLICRKIRISADPEMKVEPSERTALKLRVKRVRTHYHLLDCNQHRSKVSAFEVYQVIISNVSTFNFKNIWGKLKKYIFFASII